MGLVVEKKTLLFSIIERCVATEKLKESAFLQKSVTNLLS